MLSQGHRHHLAADVQLEPVAAGELVLKRNWKVRSSLASPVLSMWISYSASDRGEVVGPPYASCSGR
jgi:hypothetical protein